MTDKKEPQELDLYTLFQKFWDFSYRIIIKIVALLGYILRLVYRYKYLYLVFLLAAIAYAVYITQGNRKMYSGKIIVEVNDGDPFLYSGMISNLNHYLASKDPKGFAEALQVPIEQSSKIAFLFYGTLPSHIDSSGGNFISNERFEIEIGMANPDFFAESKEIVLDYLKRNDYINSLNATRIASLKERENILEKNIAEIDSLQEIVYFQNKQTDINLDSKLLLRTDKQMFYTDKLKLLQQKEAVSKELESKSETFNVLTAFQPAKMPINKIKNVLIKYITFALFLSFFISLLCDNGKIIMNFLREKEEK